MQELSCPSDVKGLLEATDQMENLEQQQLLTEVKHLNPVLHQGICWVTDLMQGKKQTPCLLTVVFALDVSKFPRGKNSNTACQGESLSAQQN